MVKMLLLIFWFVYVKLLVRICKALGCNMAILPMWPAIVRMTNHDNKNYEIAKF